MRLLAFTVVCLAVLGCEISPVVSTPEPVGSRYGDCDRAARDYCEDALRASDQDMDACIAEHRFKCVSSGARSSALRRS